MKTSNGVLTRLFSTAFLMLLSFGLFAQLPPAGQQQQEVKTDFDDAEIEKFVDANLEVTKVQQKAEQEAIQIITEKDLELERFNEIVAIQQGQSEEEATPEELAAFNEAAQEIMAVNQKNQAKMVKALEAHDVSEEEYQQIMMAYQQDEEFRAKVDAVVQKKSKG
ncbi:DUF4168 domain-containing protein [Marivirga sp. S37H4]|uniref:DUF4168 domain-containing protein n=1 Tax=Marivirga aurantiaca TaxID=2802615 RepID=A0A935C8C7_9BACT|nr:DUF4168 domain-containing protein [Marivirga aurantiaca]MBK6265541.1 DUF4168 domain-containing protein [Marivirga aurantiaca]